MGPEKYAPYWFAQPGGLRKQTVRKTDIKRILRSVRPSKVKYLSRIALLNIGYLSVSTSLIRSLNPASNRSIAVLWVVVAATHSLFDSCTFCE